MPRRVRRSWPVRAMGYQFKQAASAPSLIYGGPAAKAKAAYRMAKNVKDLINVEYKNFDNSDTTAASTTPLVFRVTGMAQGDDYNQRNGRSIKVTGFQFTNRLTASASATVPSNVRTIVVQDNQPSATAPTFAEIYSSAGSDDLTALRNRATDRGRFKVLYDRTVSFSPNGHESMIISKYFKINTHIRYDGAAANNDAKGKIFFIQLSNQSVNTVTSTKEFRLTYIDN